MINDPLTDKKFNSVADIIRYHNTSEYLVYNQRKKGKTLKQALQYALKHQQPKKNVVDPNTGIRYSSYKEMLALYGIDSTRAAWHKRDKGISYEDMVRGKTPIKDTPVVDCWSTSEPVKEEPMKEKVIHVDDYIKPSYYKEGKYECIDVLNDILSDSGLESFCRGNVIKYLWRCNSKNGLEDLIKAKYYLDKLIDVVKNKKV